MIAYLVGPRIGSALRGITAKLTPLDPRPLSVSAQDAESPERYRRNIAYFSMEIGLRSSLPTYSGGLGVLAGDYIRAAADLRVPMVAVTLLHEKGYFRQRLDSEGRQHEEEVSWNPSEQLTLLPPRVSVEVEGRKVLVRGWGLSVPGIGGFEVPVYFLDTNLPENQAGDRDFTSWLYGGDARYRLCQEIVLGIGGVRLLRALGHRSISTFHMNEGHASLLTLELLAETRRPRGSAGITKEEVREIRRHCVFTTHTPVPAGHDQFPIDLARSVLGEDPILKSNAPVFDDGRLNLTLLAMEMSGYVNAVSKKHGEVSREMFPGTTIEPITNGVHSLTWVCPAFRDLFDRYLPGWRQDSSILRYAVSIPTPELDVAHNQAKAELARYLADVAGIAFRPDVFTIGFARRAAGYKRADLLFWDLERLKRMARTRGPIQIVMAGKAHPKDGEGKALIERVIHAIRQLGGEIHAVYLPNYRMDMAKEVIPGVDLWLNTPRFPLEASGTSGMKAAHNGVPSLSILDGWWIEGHREGVTGWAIYPAGGHGPGPSDDLRDGQALYDKLDQTILPMFYTHRNAYLEIMRYSIALNASYFNTHRMVQEYVTKAYASR